MTGSMVDLEIRLYSVPWDSRMAFCLMGRGVGPKDERRHYRVTNPTFELMEDGQLLQPTFSLGRDQVQALMDELYRLGVRPSEQGTVEAREVAKAHLRGMRALVAQLDREITTLETMVLAGTLWGVGAGLGPVDQPSTSGERGSVPEGSDCLR